MIQPLHVRYCRRARRWVSGDGRTPTEVFVIHRSATSRSTSAVISPTETHNEHVLLISSRAAAHGKTGLVHDHKTCSGLCLAGKVGQPQRRHPKPSRIQISQRGSTGNTVIIKSVRHFRLHNERDVLARFRSRTPFIRPLVDEIIEPTDPPAIVLKYLEAHLLHAASTQRLTKAEIKHVARRVLQALDVLHREGLVHTGQWTPMRDTSHAQAPF